MIKKIIVGFSTEIKQFSSFSREIYRKKVTFNHKNQTKIEIIFDKPIRNLSLGYLSRITSTIRILSFIYDFIPNVTTIEPQQLIESITQINHYCCFYNTKTDQKVKKIFILDLNSFFKKYKSTHPKYQYINNSIPWLLLINQIPIILIRIRIEFTLIDMLGRCLNNGNKTMFQNFLEFVNACYDDFAEDINNFFNISFKKLNTFKSTLIKKSITSFNSITNIIKVTIKGKNKKKEFKDFLYEMRNSYFHGNMTALYNYDERSLKFFNELEKLLYKMVRQNIYNIINKI